MTMDEFSDYLNFIYTLKREGIKLDLGITRLFSGYLGNPENSFESYHIAGSNGKGSTAALIYNILSERFRTGLYTSPHLIDFSERIISGKVPISREYVTEFIRSNASTVHELMAQNRNPTFFEFTTIMAFKYFQDTGAEFASIEVGLGGRLDSTNIIKPRVSIITQVGYEHADKLGGSLTSIATEKAGIIKDNVPAVLGDNKPEVTRTIRRIASLRNSTLYEVDRDTVASDIQYSLEGTSLKLSTPKREYKLKSNLTGVFQPRNIASAVLAMEADESVGITKGDIERGVANTIWPGRLQKISSKPTVLVDCAHNPPAANALRISLKKLGVENPLAVVGMLSDKDVYSFLKVMSQITDRVVFTTPDEPDRAVDPHKLENLGGKFFRELSVVPNLKEAYNLAKESSDLVLVTGSMYLVGAIMEMEKISALPFKR
ncbi:MAG: folylpolyglutamate synthase/dihydrofolate synthase family protein [Thermoplasmataceae archaeon]